jgi:hypothetical protein
LARYDFCLDTSGLYNASTIDGGFVQRLVAMRLFTLMEIGPSGLEMGHGSGVVTSQAPYTGTYGRNAQ